MKRLLVLLAVALMVTVPGVLEGQTILWHNAVFDTLADSGGAGLDGSFTIELGTFVDGFAPVESNAGDWYANWLVFDQADFNPGLGYFTGEVVMQPDGTSDSPALTPGAPSFEGKSAYIWIRKGTQAMPMSEWMLVSDASWVYPVADPNCCGNGVPLEWAISDLDGGDTPKWGGQGGVPGPGVVTQPGPYTLQTYTFVPESSLVALLGWPVLVWCGRRRC